VRGWLTVSVLVHGVLALGVAHGAARSEASDGARRDPIAFELAVAARIEPDPVDGVEGKRHAGLDARPTGEPDTQIRGSAGHDGESGHGVQRRGPDPEDRVTTREDARTLARTLGELVRASDAAPRSLGVTSPVPERGSRDEDILGLARAGTLVSPGMRGLDMTGVGRGSGPRGERDATIGERAFGLGALGASDRRDIVPRGRFHEDVCITMEQGCPHRRPRLVLAVEVLAGLLTVADARRTVQRARSAIGACASVRPIQITLAVDANGHVRAAVATPVAPCERAALDALQFSPAIAGSYVRVTIQRVLF
jgi:hypothetical protein